MSEAANDNHSPSYMRLDKVIKETILEKPNHKKQERYNRSFLYKNRSIVSDEPYSRDRCNYPYYIVVLTNFTKYSVQNNRAEVYCEPSFQLAAKPNVKQYQTQQAYAENR